MINPSSLNNLLSHSITATPPQNSFLFPFPTAIQPSLPQVRSLNQDTLPSLLSKRVNPFELADSLSKKPKMSSNNIMTNLNSNYGIYPVQNLQIQGPFQGHDLQHRPEITVMPSGFNSNIQGNFGLIGQNWQQNTNMSVYVKNFGHSSLNMSSNFPTPSGISSNGNVLFLQDPNIIVQNQGFNQPSPMITVMQQVPPQYTVNQNMPSMQNLQNGFQVISIQKNQDLPFQHIMPQNFQGTQPFMIANTQHMQIQSNVNPVYLIPMQGNQIYTPAPAQLNLVSHPFLQQQMEIPQQNKVSPSLAIINDFLRNKTEADKTFVPAIRNDPNSNFPSHATQKLELLPESVKILDEKIKIGTTTAIKIIADKNDIRREMSPQQESQKNLDSNMAKQTPTKGPKDTKDEIIMPPLQEKSQTNRNQTKSYKTEILGMTRRSQAKQENSALRTRNKGYVFKGKGDKKRIIAKPRMSLRRKIETVETPIIYVMSSIQVGPEHQAEIPRIASNKNDKVKKELNPKWSPHSIEELKLLDLRNNLEEILKVKVSCEKVIELLTNNEHDSEKVLDLVRDDVREYNKFFRIRERK